MIGALIARDVRRGFTGAAWLPVAFFLLIATLMPFAVGPDARLLSRIGSGVLWIAALTAALLPIERLVEPDRAEVLDVDPVDVAQLGVVLVAQVAADFREVLVARRAAVREVRRGRVRCREGDGRGERARRNEQRGQ